MSRYICIHGHFYQPPRENPWLEAIELQDAAYPFHDWNARITHECYQPNARSRILDGQGRITTITNNYAKISFNFGPTLLSWMQAGAPEVYHAILDADEQSRERFSGHGSAMAQPYNHMILPLANERDCRTQVIWGIRDFEHRFGRRPEGMWLPETAAATPTLEILAEQGIRFTVLAPRQARYARPVRGGRGRELHGGVDPRRAYECRLPSGRQIALFFYDGPISQAVAFEGLLSSGSTFANRILGGLDGRQGPQLAHIATDGETYGHHHRHGDMALAFAIRQIEANPDVALTNYGEFLEREPPRHIVEIVENSSWSCMHGIERWRADCGCHSGGHPGWNQQWRAPLREALDWLRDMLIPRYERAAGALLHDAWKARDDYVEVLLDQERATAGAFLAGHARRELTGPERTTVWKLMELQRHAMLMYTSCGWFFDDLSGIETVQVIRYAARALQLAQDLFGDSIEGEFLDRLSAARSNSPEHGDGRKVYEKFVRPAIVDLPKVGAHYAISSLFETYGEKARIHCYDVIEDHSEWRSAGRARIRIGGARAVSRITEESQDFKFAAVHFGDHLVTGAVGRFDCPEAYQAFVQHALEAFDRADLVALLQRMEAAFPGSIYTQASLFRDEQRRIVTIVIGALLKDVEATYRRMYEHHAPLLRFLGSLGVPPPRALDLPAEFVLNARFRDALASAPPNLKLVNEVLAEARAQSVSLDKVTLSFRAEAAIEQVAVELAMEPRDADRLRRTLDMAELVRALPFDVDVAEVQNTYWELRQGVRPNVAGTAATGDESAANWLDTFDRLGDRLGFGAP